MSDAKPAPDSHHPEDDKPDWVERERRARVFKKGKMMFQGGLRSIPCLVRNVSSSGALLVFEEAYMLPKEFDLRIDLENFEVSCERRWEDGLRCGIKFIGEKRPVSAQRAQVLKTSEEALKEEIDERRESPDNFFSRRQSGKQEVSSEPVRPARTAGSGKPGFGKRR